MNLAIDKNSKVPTYKQIAETVRKQISDGIVGPGDPLPSARELSSKLNISVPTVTRAYSLLDDSGLTFTHHGKGTFVCASGRAISGREMPVEKKNCVFISYAHSDEEASCGAVSKFRDALIREYRLQTGEPLDVFFDKTSIEWGANWRDTIQQSIGGTLFFMPFLSPAYLNSTACMGELRTARLAFGDRGIERGVFPVMFVNCIERIKELDDDALASSLQDDQWRDIGDLQYEDPSSPSYRKAMREIVKEMLRISRDINDNLLSLAPVPEQAEKTEDSDLGVLDAFQNMEDESARAVGEIERFGNLIEAIGNITSPYTSKLSDAQTFKEKLLCIRQYSNELTPYADKSKDTASEINLHVDRIDRCVETILDYIPEIIDSSENEEKDGLGAFCQNLITLYENAQVGFDGARGFLAQIEPLGKMSRDLKSPVNTLRTALDLFLSNEDTFRRWERESRAVLANLTGGEECELVPLHSGGDAGDE